MTAAVVLLTLVFLSVLVHVVPGDPVKIILGPRATEALSQLVRDEMQLDEPVAVQVWNFVTGAIQGDLGTDFTSRLPVTEIIGSALPHTLILAVSALGVAVVLGIPLGVFAATHPNTVADRVMAVLSVSMIALPAFVAGLFLLVLVSVRLDLLPAIGSGSLSDPVDYARHLVLPTLALAVTWIGYLARLVRTSMLEVLGANYIRTAAAFGLPKRLIFYKYALRNAIIPTAAVLGVGLGNLIATSIFVETIFTRPGLGTLLLDAIQTRNYPVVRGSVFVIVLFVVLANLLADVSYRLLDPRIRLEGRSA